jgi:hypothetical protein
MINDGSRARSAWAEMNPDIFYPPAQPFLIVCIDIVKRGLEAKLSIRP